MDPMYDEQPVTTTEDATDTYLTTICTLVRYWQAIAASKIKSEMKPLPGETLADTAIEGMAFSMLALVDGQNTQVPGLICLISGDGTDGMWGAVAGKMLPDDMHERFFPRLKKVEGIAQLPGKFPDMNAVGDDAPTDEPVAFAYYGKHKLIYVFHEDLTVTCATADRLHRVRGLDAPKWADLPAFLEESGEDLTVVVSDTATDEIKRGIVARYVTILEGTYVAEPKPQHPTTPTGKMN